jgi:hypothetical protein
MADVLHDKLEASQAEYAADRRRLQQHLAALRAVAGTGDEKGPITISRRLRYGVQAVAREGRFNPLFVEALLQQAGGLVDRVASEEATYRQLRVDQTNLRLDLKEFLALQAINDDEVAAGLFNLGFWEASTTAASDQAQKTAQTALIAWVQSREEDQRRYSAWSTENAQLPLATGWEGKLSKHTLKLFDGYTPAQVPSGSSVTDGNIVGGNLSYLLSGYSLDYSQEQIRSQIAPIDARASFIQSRLAYAQADVGFKQRRRNAAHGKLAAKLDATLAPNGPLNYAARLEAIEDRAATSLREAHIRMRVASRGIPLVYGIDVPQVPLLPAGEGDFPPPDIFERTIEWIREVGLLLQDIYNRDQDIVFGIWLKDLLGHQAFEEGKEKGAWSFDFPSGYFRDFGLLRLRALSANSQCRSGRHYGLVITPPSDTHMIYGPAWSEIARRQRVDRLWISRIFPEDYRRGPDLFGLRTLSNASPLGTWHVTAAPGSDFHGLDDLLLSFNLTVQPL